MMNRPDIFAPLIYVLAAVPYAWLGLYAWHKRPAVAVTSFAYVMLSMSIWTSMYGLEIFSEQLSTKIIFQALQYVGIVTIPVNMLFFALEFTGRSHLLTPPRRAIVWAFPITILLLVITNSFHHWMWDQETVIQIYNLHLFGFEVKPLFWVHITFSYSLLMVACLLLILEMLQRPGLYRIQISLVILSILFPLIGNIIFLTQTGFVRNLDITPLLFLPSAIGLSWAIIKYRLLEVLPLEHMTVLKNMKDSVIVLNAQKRILYINSTAETLLNTKEATAIGQPFEKVSKIHSEILLPYITHKEEFAEVKWEKEKEVRTYELTVSPVTSLNSTQPQTSLDRMMILRDITERKVIETALLRRELIMSSISMAAEQFLREARWEHNIPAVLEKIGQAAQVSRVWVAMNYTDENNIIHSSLCYEWASASMNPQIDNPHLQHIALRKRGLARWEELLSQGFPIDGLVKNFPESEQEIFKHLLSVSVAVLPIFVDSQWWGFIMFDECQTERAWTSTELEAFHIAASIFGAAESRARAEQKIIRRQRTLSLLNDIVRVALKANDINQMTEVIVERVGQLINADSCFLALWDESNKRAIPLAAFGPQKNVYATASIKPDTPSFTESALQAGHTLIIENFDTYEQVENYAPRTQSMLVLPLIAEEKKLGAVILTFNKKHHFPADEISICEQASALIALALEKFQSMEEARRRANTSEILRKASMAVAEQLEMGQTVSHILEQLNQVLPSDTASVQLLEENTLHIIGGRGWENQNDVLGMSFPIPGDNPNTIVIQTGKPYYVTDAYKKYKAFKQSPQQGILSWLGVPLIAQNKTIGLLALDSLRPDRFTEEDIKTATEFANQVAIALENARIYEESQNLAITDSLTNIYNRRGLTQLGEFEYQRAQRIHRPFSAIMLDIDYFKRINDQHTHAIGDQILQQFAKRCSQNLRGIDILGRYGGEEFLILLPETNLQIAYLVANRLHQSILKSAFPTDVGDLRVTASIGVAESRLNESLSNLIQRADTMLYKAKETGRNKIIIDDGN